jgi:hypothetical protein
MSVDFVKRMMCLAMLIQCIVLVAIPFISMVQYQLRSLIQRWPPHQERKRLKALRKIESNRHCALFGLDVVEVVSLRRVPQGGSFGSCGHCEVRLVPFPRQQFRQAVLRHSCDAGEYVG